MGTSGVFLTSEGFFTMGTSTIFLGSEGFLIMGTSAIFLASVGFFAMGTAFGTYLSSECFYSVDFVPFVSL